MVGVTRFALFLHFPSACACDDFWGHGCVDSLSKERVLTIDGGQLAA
jgi:hypothetical protein